MKDLNKILLQFNKGVELSNSQFYQEKSMSIILLDNLIEIRLYKLVEDVFNWDKTSWHTGRRTFSKKDRESAIGPTGKYDRLLWISKKANFISEQELEIIKFVHEIRNGIYHRGEENTLKINVAILIYYSLLRTKLESWDSHRHGTSYSPDPQYQEIDFGQGKKKRITDLDFLNRQYFNDCISAILGKWKITNNLAATASTLLLEQVSETIKAIEFLKSELKNLNYYDALSEYSYLIDSFTNYYPKKRWPKNLDRVLLLTLFIRENRDYLDDMPDTIQRQKEGRRLLKKQGTKYQNKYTHWIDLEKIETRIKTLKGKSDHIIIKNIIDIQNKISSLYSDTQEAALQLSGYIEFLSDVARGK